MPVDDVTLYLRAISSRLGLDRAREEEIAKELATHLEESYSILYADIIRTAPPPLNATGPILVGLWIMIYIVPLLLVSSPAYIYLKKRSF